MSRTSLLLLCLYISQVAAVARDSEGERCSPKTCGNLTISHPFWLAKEQLMGRLCGSLDFIVHCRNNTPFIGNFPHEYSFKILDIFYSNDSFLVSDIHKLQDFNNCTVPHVNTSVKLRTASFSIGPVNMDILFYDCTNLPTAARPELALVPMKCGKNSFVRVGGYHDASDDYKEYFLEGCNTCVVPVLGTSAKTYARDYEQLIRNGFLLTWSLVPDDRHHNKLILIVSLSATTGLLFTMCLVFWVMHRQKKNLSPFILQKNTGRESNTEEILKGYQPLAPKRYKYSELKKITRSFKDKLGEGGYGMVFKGSLQDGRMVAVKLLKGSKGNGEEFLNEIVSIGRTSHVNIVSILGFCLQGSKRALVYEYMANGSLEKYIYSEKSKLVIGWEKLQQIAIGVARGLEYLHRGCSTRIIHFDIKPHNILLDQDFCPKIADFGLAKLCHLKNSALSMAETRGTIGFIAPEVFSRGFGVVSTKSDVYSYGMMLLEMVGGRKNINENTENSSEMYFPNSMYDHLVSELHGCEVTCERGEIVRKITLVGLWCIQTNPGIRPSMSKVIEMLAKNISELEMPPKPFLSYSSPPSYCSSKPS